MPGELVKRRSGLKLVRIDLPLPEAAEVLADYRRGDVQMLGFVIAAIARTLDGAADAL